MSKALSDQLRQIHRRQDALRMGDMDEYRKLTQESAKLEKGVGEDEVTEPTDSESVVEEVSSEEVSSSFPPAEPSSTAPLGPLEPLEPLPPRPQEELQQGEIPGADSPSWVELAEIRGEGAFRTAFAHLQDFVLENAREGGIRADTPLKNRKLESAIGSAENLGGAAAVAASGHPFLAAVAGAVSAYPTILTLSDEVFGTEFGERGTGFGGDPLDPSQWLGGVFFPRTTAQNIQDQKDRLILKTFPKDSPEARAATERLKVTETSDIIAQVVQLNNPGEVASGHFNDRAYAQDFLGASEQIEDPGYRAKTLRMGLELEEANEAIQRHFSGFIDRDKLSPLFWQTDFMGRFGESGVNISDAVDDLTSLAIDRISKENPKLSIAEVKDQADKFVEAELKQALQGHPFAAGTAIIDIGDDDAIKELLEMEDRWGESYGELGRLVAQTLTPLAAILTPAPMTQRMDLMSPESVSTESTLASGARLFNLAPTSLWGVGAKYGKYPVVGPLLAKMGFIDPEDAVLNEDAIRFLSEGGDIVDAAPHATRALFDHIYPDALPGSDEWNAMTANFQKDHPFMAQAPVLVAGMIFEPDAISLLFGGAGKLGKTAMKSARNIKYSQYIETIEGDLLPRMEELKTLLDPYVVKSVDDEGKEVYTYKDVPPELEAEQAEAIQSLVSGALDATKDDPELQALFQNNLLLSLNKTTAEKVKASWQTSVEARRALAELQSKTAKESGDAEKALGLELRALEAEGKTADGTLDITTTKLRLVAESIRRVMPEFFDENNLSVKKVKKLSRKGLQRTIEAATKRARKSSEALETVLHNSKETFEIEAQALKRLQEQKQLLEKTLAFAKKGIQAGDKVVVKLGDAPVTGKFVEVKSVDGTQKGVVQIATKKGPEVRSYDLKDISFDVEGLMKRFDPRRGTPPSTMGKQFRKLAKGVFFREMEGDFRAADGSIWTPAKSIESLKEGQLIRWVDDGEAKLADEMKFGRPGPEGSAVVYLGKSTNDPDLMRELPLDQVYTLKHRDVESQLDAIIALTEARAVASAMHQGEEATEAAINAWYVRNFKGFRAGLEGEFKPLVEGEELAAQGDLFDDIMYQADGTIDESSKNFAKWRGEGAAAVDETGEMVPLYHGTTQRFEGFDPDAGPAEAYFGRAIYLTTNENDAYVNYSHAGGADLKQKIELLMERLVFTFEEEFNELSDAVNDFAKANPAASKELLKALDEDDAFDAVEAALAKIDHTMEDLAEFVANKELVGEGPLDELTGAISNILPVYTNVKNPVIVSKKGGTYLDGEQLEEMMSSIDMNLRDYGLPDIADEVEAALIDRGVFTFDGGDAWEVDAALREVLFRASEGYLQEFGTSHNELIRDGFKAAGFDSIKLNAYDAFGPKKFAGFRTQGMDALTPDTWHWHVFDGPSVKSIFNKGKWSPEDNRLLYQLADEAPSEDLEALVKRLKPSLKNLWMNQIDDDLVRLSQIEVDKASRGKGVGSKALREVAKWADANGKTITLTPEAEKGKKAKLEAWYKSHGFVRNKGKVKDFRSKDSWIRLPQEAPAAPKAIDLPATAGATTAEEAVEAARLWKELGTESPYFKKWFGDSKAVDFFGNPLVLFHGTSKGGFTEFAREEGMIHYFTRDRGQASTYAYGDAAIDLSEGRRKKRQRGIYDVYLRLRNPLVVEYSGRRWDDPRMHDFGQGPEEFDNIEDLAEAARDAGYDGVIAQNIIDYGEFKTKAVDEAVDQTKPTTEYLVFDPENIKSTANRGTFDETGRLLFQGADEPASVDDIVKVLLQEGDEGATARAKARIKELDLPSVRAYTDFEVVSPKSRDRIKDVLPEKKARLVDVTDSFEAGKKVGVRLDIPTYTRTQREWDSIKGTTDQAEHDVVTFVATVHDRATKDPQTLDIGKAIGYAPGASLKNVSFTVNPKSALGVLEGKAKSTFASANGEWVPRSSEELTADAKRAFELSKEEGSEWVQVGMNPQRHQYFFTRDAAQRPVLEAEEVIQIGPLVLAKKPKYGKAEDFLYQEGDTGAKHGDFYFDADTLSRLREQVTKYGERETLVYLTPDEFLGMATRLDRPVPQKVDRIGKALDAGKKFNDIPYLLVKEDGTVSGHEGRHRAMALKALGVERIPVRLRSNDIRWNEQLPSKMMEEGQKAWYWVETLPKQLTGQDGVTKMDAPFYTEGPNRGQVLPERRADLLSQGEEGSAKAAVQFVEDNKAILYAFEQADVSSLLHEIGHVFRRDLTENSPSWQGWYDHGILVRAFGAKSEDSRHFDRMVAFEGGEDMGGIDLTKAGKRRSPEALDKLHSRRKATTQRRLDKKAAQLEGIIDSARWTVDSEERFARAFEKYLATGRSPSLELDGVFKKFKSWLTEIYVKIRGSAIGRVESEEVRRVFDRMLTGAMTVEGYSSKNFNKDQLKAMLDSRGILYKSKDNKKVLAKKLADDDLAKTQEYRNFTTRLKEISKSAKTPATKLKLTADTAKLVKALEKELKPIQTKSNKAQKEILKERTKFMKAKAQRNEAKRKLILRKAYDEQQEAERAVKTTQRDLIEFTGSSLKAEEHLTKQLNKIEKVRKKIDSSNVVPGLERAIKGMRDVVELLQKEQLVRPARRNLMKHPILKSVIRDRANGTWIIDPKEFVDSIDEFYVPGVLERFLDTKDGLYLKEIIDAAKQGNPTLTYSRKRMNLLQKGLKRMEDQYRAGYLSTPVQGTLDQIKQSYRHSNAKKIRVPVPFSDMINGKGVQIGVSGSGTRLLWHYYDIFDPNYSKFGKMAPKLVNTVNRKERFVEHALGDLHNISKTNLGKDFLGEHVRYFDTTEAIEGRYGSTMVNTMGQGIFKEARNFIMSNIKSDAKGRLTFTDDEGGKYTESLINSLERIFLDSADLKLQPRIPTGQAARMRKKVLELLSDDDMTYDKFLRELGEAAGRTDWGRNEARGVTMASRALIDAASWQHTIRAIANDSYAMLTPEEGLVMANFMEGNISKVTDIDALWSAASKLGMDLSEGKIRPGRKHGQSEKAYIKNLVRWNLDDGKALSPEELVEYNTKLREKLTEKGLTPEEIEPQLIVSGQKVTDPRQVFMPSHVAESMAASNAKFVKELETYYTRPKGMDPQAFTESFVRAWKGMITSGLGLPRPKYFVNNILGDFSQMWQNHGIYTAGKVSAQNVLTNMPYIGPSIQNVTSKMSEKFGGIPILSTAVEAIFSPDIGRIFKGEDGVIEFPDETVSLVTVRENLALDGVLDTFTSREVNANTRQAAKELTSDLEREYGRAIPGKIKDRFMRRAKSDLDGFATQVQQRQRVGLYLEMRKQGRNHAEAVQEVKDSLYDWSLGFSSWEQSWQMGLLVPFYRFWRLAAGQMIRAGLEPFVMDSSEYTLKALTGQTQLARMKAQARILAGIPKWAAYAEAEAAEEGEESEAFWGSILAKPWWGRPGMSYIASLASQEQKDFMLQDHGRNIDTIATAMSAPMTGAELYSLGAYILTTPLAAAKAAVNEDEEFNGLRAWKQMKKFAVDIGGPTMEAVLGERRASKSGYRRISPGQESALKLFGPLAEIHRDKDGRLVANSKAVALIDHLPVLSSQWADSINGWEWSKLFHEEDEVFRRFLYTLAHISGPVRDYPSSTDDTLYFAAKAVEEQLKGVASDQVRGEDPKEEYRRLNE